MTRRRLFWTAYAAGFIVAAIIAVFAFSMLNRMVPPQVNWQALQLTTLDGKPVTLDEYKGKPVLINVWATWCKPCLEEMPSLNRLLERNPNSLTVLTVSDEEAEKLAKFKAQNPYSFSYLRATTPLSGESLTIFPITYLLDKNGDLEAIYLGPQNWDSEKLQQQVLQAN